MAHLKTSLNSSNTLLIILLKLLFLAHACSLQKEDSALLTPSLEVEAVQPNIILFLADDMGWEGAKLQLYKLKEYPDITAQMEAIIKKEHQPTPFWPLRSESR
ncbi:MAG: hypothetical protein AAFO07_05710 [Bacteroidota bacterium]